MSYYVIECTPVGGTQIGHVAFSRRAAIAAAQQHSTTTRRCVVVEYRRLNPHTDRLDQRTVATFENGKQITNADQIVPPREGSNPSQEALVRVQSADHHSITLALAKLTRGAA